MDLDILMIDDSEEDYILVAHALQACKFQGRLQHVTGGDVAMNYLQGRAPYSDRTRYFMPNTLLLDLKMPRMDGFEFLVWLRKHPHCAIIPTVIYSSSFIQSDVSRAYQLGANAFLSKPTGLQQTVRQLAALREFWLLCERPAFPPDQRCD